MRIKSIVVMLSWLVCTTLAAAQTASEQATSAYLEKIKNRPQFLQVFLQNMPKGGDLHKHPGGASMAENMLRYALGDKLCVDRKTSTVTQNPQCASGDWLDNSATDGSFYNALIDAWSMRNATPGSGHDHFFATFGKYSLISKAHNTQILAEVIDRAGQQNESYLELMLTPESASALGDSVGWNDNFKLLRDKLLTAGIGDVAERSIKKIEEYDAKERQILACDSASPAAGCKVKVRYLFQVLRENQPVQVFAQLLAGFETVNRDHGRHFVGINLVQPEDGYLSMRDYALQMKMIGFLHEITPVVIQTRQGTQVVDMDEHPASVKIEKIPQLQPVFLKGGTITAANASSIADGAAALVLMRLSEAKKRGIKPLAKILAHSTHAKAPGEFTTAPIDAIRHLLEKIHWTIADVDLFEINEAFAVVAMAAMRDLQIPHAKLNRDGGGCALGHPIGATGARILVTLIGALQRNQLQRGIAALCIGGGEATAVAVEML